MIEQWDGKPWSVVLSPTRSPIQPNVLYDVTCELTCWAAGTHSTALPQVNVSGTGTARTLIMANDGDGWRIVDSPNASGSQGLLNSEIRNYLVGVSCDQEGDCVSVGAASPNRDQTVILEGGVNGWSLVSSPNSSTNDNNHLSDVACNASGQCVAVGWYGGPSTSQTLILERK